MSDKFSMDVRQASELSFAFERNGYTNAEIKKLSSGDLLGRLLPVIRGNAEVAVTQHVIDLDADPFVPEGWKVEEHKKGGQFIWDPSQLRLYLSEHQKPGKSIEGNKLRKELKSKPTFNACLLDYLIDHPHLIPEEWKKNEEGNTLYIFFWDTVYRHSDGGVCVRYLYFVGGHWRWRYVWLDAGFGCGNPALVRASETQN